MVDEGENTPRKGKAGFPIQRGERFPPESDGEGGEVDHTLTPRES